MRVSTNLSVPLSGSQKEQLHILQREGTWNHLEGTCKISFLKEPTRCYVREGKPFGTLTTKWLPNQKKQKVNRLIWASKCKNQGQSPKAPIKRSLSDRRGEVMMGVWGTLKKQTFTRMGKTSCQYLTPWSSMTESPSNWFPRASLGFGVQLLD